MTKPPDLDFGYKVDPAINLQAVLDLEKTLPNIRSIKTIAKERLSKELPPLSSPFVVPQEPKPNGKTFFLNQGIEFIQGEKLAVQYSIEVIHHLRCDIQMRDIHMSFFPIHAISKTTTGKIATTIQCPEIDSAEALTLHWYLQHLTQSSKEKDKILISLKDLELLKEYAKSENKNVSKNAISALTNILSSYHNSSIDNLLKKHSGDGGPFSAELLVRIRKFPFFQQAVPLYDQLGSKWHMLLSATTQPPGKQENSLFYKIDQIYAFYILTTSNLINSANKTRYSERQEALQKSFQKILEPPSPQAKNVCDEKKKSTPPSPARSDPAIEEVVEIEKLSLEPSPRQQLLTNIAKSTIPYPMMWWAKRWAHLSPSDIEIAREFPGRSKQKTYKGLTPEDLQKEYAYHAFPSIEKLLNFTELRRKYSKQKGQQITFVGEIQFRNKKAMGAFRLGLNGENQVVHRYFHEKSSQHLKENNADELAGKQELNLTELIASGKDLFYQELTDDQLSFAEDIYELTDTQQFTIYNEKTKIRVTLSPVNFGNAY